MTTFQKAFSLSKPTGEDQAPLEALGYFRARNRNRVYDAVVREFSRSGISRATLARRLHKRPEVISRLLGAPGNWTLDTVSDLLFAISEAEVQFKVSHPLEEPMRNNRYPDWLADAVGVTGSMESPQRGRSSGEDLRNNSLTHLGGSPSWGNIGSSRSDETTKFLQKKAVN